MKAMGAKLQGNVHVCTIILLRKLKMYFQGKSACGIQLQSSVPESIKCPLCLKKKSVLCVQSLKVLILHVKEFPVLTNPTLFFFSCIIFSLIYPSFMIKKLTDLY